MKTELNLSRLNVRPGVEARVDVEVTNTSDIIDGVGAEVEGIPWNWWRPEPGGLNLFPNASGLLGVVIDVPANGAAGNYAVDVRVGSQADDDPGPVIPRSFWLTVEPVIAVGIDLRPAIVNGGRRASLIATISNNGNADAVVRIDAFEPTRAVECEVSPPSLFLPLGASADVSIELSGARPWIGQPIPRLITVRAVVDDIRLHHSPAEQHADPKIADVAGPPTVDTPFDSAPAESVATFNQKPIVPRGVITALTLAAIVALWALILIFGTRLLGRDEAGKQLAAAFFVGEPDVPLAEIAGRASGNVIAKTTKEGLARITVEAFRLPAGGDDEEPRQLVGAGSTATTDEGTFLLPALLPGNYKLRITGEGFDDVWYCPKAAQKGSDDADGTSAEEHTCAPVPEADGGWSLAVPPKGAEREEFLASDLVSVDVPTPESATGSAVADVANTLEIELVGKRGRLSGSFDLPPALVDENGFVPTVQARLKGPPPTARPQSPPPGGGVEVDGQRTDEQRNDEQRSDGAADAMCADADAAAAAADGVHTAQVNGTGFDFTCLPTPATYVISIADPLGRYEAQSFPRTLAGGDDSVANPLPLVAALGSITGTVVTADSREPLGNVTVTARSGDIAIGVSTPTTEENIGRFEIRDLPTPLTYTLSFDRPGYGARTTSFDLGPGEQYGAEGSDPPFVVELSGGTGRVTGSAFSNVPTGDPNDANGGLSAGPLGAVSVEIEGEDYRASSTTLTSGSDAGSFTIEEIPVPAACLGDERGSANCAYTVTFSRAGLETEAVSVTFAGARSVPPVTVTMVPARVAVSGRVVAGDTGVGLAGVTVTLSDGSDPTAGGGVLRTTTSASAPTPGQFSFGEVEAGTYTMAFEHPEYATRVVLTRTQGGADTPLQVTLARSTTVEGG